MAYLTRRDRHPIAPWRADCHLPLQLESMTLFLSRPLSKVIAPCDYRDVAILVTYLNSGEIMNGFRLFLASLRFTNNRFERYYGKIVTSGVGAPTADEARRDLARTREQQIAAQIMVR
jgi:hypothetical protein